MMIGHYSKQGQKIREVLDESALEMFWLIHEKNAFGGRAALLPLLKLIISTKKSKKITLNIKDDCQQECKTIKSVFLHSASLLSNSKTIKLS